MKRTLAVLAPLFLVGFVTEAQDLKLPSIDGVTAYYRAGHFVHRELHAKPTAPCASVISALRTCGWGFETVYHLTKDGSAWGSELAVGYDFLTLRGTIGESSQYELHGSMQTLPSITLYVSRGVGKRGGFYFGLGTGLVVLKNVRAYDDTNHVYAIAGDAWAFTPSFGISYDARLVSDHGPGLTVFAELAYEVRDFPSLGYTLPSDIKTLPADLPRSLSATATVFNIGFEITFRKKSEPASAPARPFR